MLICFDYDGVIVDSAEHLLDIAKRSQHKVGSGRAPTRSDFEKIPNLTLPELTKYLDIPREDLRAFAREFDRLLLSNDTILSVFPDIPTVLRTLSRTHVLCVITANLRRVVERTFAEHGLHEIISLVVDGVESGSKADKIAKAIHHFDTDVRHTIMVGDTQGDIRYGKQVGVHTIGVTWGYQSRAFLREEDPDFFAERPTDLLSIIDTALASVRP